MIVLSALLVAMQPAPAPVEPQVFRDWVVACDNGRRCQASSLVADEGDWDQVATLFLERDPGSEAPLRIGLVNSNEAPVRLLVDGALFPVRISAEGVEYTVEPRDPEAFTSALMAGARLELQGATGALAGQASLAGLTATLLYMDEQQQRVGTRTALARPGDRPASAVPPPPRLPEARLSPVTAETALAIPPQRVDLLRRETGCTFEEVGGPEEIQTAPLGGGQTLLLLPCGSGAYNVSYIPFVARREGGAIAVAAAPFDVPVDNSTDSGQRLLINAEWDETQRRLHDFSKARGLGDCGVASTYGWDGTRFRLLLQLEMPECRGSTSYVTTWRAEAR